MSSFAGPRNWWSYEYANPHSTVQNGLILNLDSSVDSSYPGSGTTWTDLSTSGYNTTLTSTTFDSNNGGSLVYDGTTSTALVSIPSSFALTSATFITWIKRNGNQLTLAGLLYCRTSASVCHGFAFNNSTGNKLGYCWNGSSTTYNYDSGLVPPDGVWCMGAVVVESTGATFYLAQTSGITTATQATPLTSATINTLKVGNDDVVSTRKFKGNISNVSLYNRALSSTEIQQNFNALRGRYGV